MNYSDPSAVFTPPNSAVKIDPNDPAFTHEVGTDGDMSLPAIYLFSNSADGDGVAYAMAEDGTVLGSHFCSHWGYMRHDLHDRADRKATCEAHYPGGYCVVVLGARETPPKEVLDRNTVLGITRKVQTFIDPYVLLEHLEADSRMVADGFAAGKDTVHIPADHTRVGVYPLIVARESVGL